MKSGTVDLEYLIRELAEKSPDEAARRLRKLPKRERAAVAASLANRRRQEVLALADYDAGTAGSLMTSRHADVPADITAKEAIARLARETDAETIYTAYVLDDESRLIGVVSLRDLLRAEGKALVRDAMRQDPERAFAEDDDTATAQRLLEAPMTSLPVVDRDNHLLGIITFDDAHRRVAEASRENSDQFHAISGDAPDMQYLEVSVWAEIRRRVPWVLTLAVAGLLAGYIVHVYESALDALVILALYMPMLADTGGNVGTQSSSLIIQAVATGEIGLKQGARVLWKEARVAVFLAFVLFSFAFLKVTFMSNNADVPAGLTLEMIALAIAVAIAVQVFVSTLIGALLPLAAIALRQDPALVSGPALTTIVDVIGLFLYFTITTTFLGIPGP